MIRAQEILIGDRKLFRHEARQTRTRAQISHRISLSSAGQGPEQSDWT